MLRVIITGLLIMVAPAPLYAQSIDEPSTLIYFGAGHSQPDSRFKSSSAPFSVGAISLKEGEAGFFAGVDIAGEGTVLDSTYNYSKKPRQAASLNLIVGTNMGKWEKSRLDVGLLLGIRQYTKDCSNSPLSRSLIGYQCYADTVPSTDYRGNVGGVAFYSYNHFAFGVRVTGESKQIVLGRIF